MKELFDDILSVNGVVGAALISIDSNILFDSFNSDALNPIRTYPNWKKLFQMLKDTQEADFVFESGRFYMRRVGKNYIVISMQSFASIAMVKLNCDILIPQLNTTKSTKGLRSFFKR